MYNFLFVFNISPVLIINCYSSDQDTNKVVVSRLLLIERMYSHIFNLKMVFFFYKSKKLLFSNPKEI